MKTIIAAQPGFDVVELCSDPDELIFTPVIGWLIIDEEDENVYMEIQPITTDWNCNHPKSKALRYPDGTIMFIDGPTFAKGQEAKALAHLIECRKKRSSAA